MLYHRTIRKITQTSSLSPPSLPFSLSRKEKVGEMLIQSRKWTVLIATTWIQAFTGTNFDFSAYSSDLKSVLGISQVQLNYLSVASDMGKAFGWCSGVSLLYFPLWVVLFMAAFMGFFGYGVQWLVIHKFINLPYFLVFLLCLLAGCSICWFNTVCYVLCIRNFPTNRPLALSLTISFNGVSAALYTLIANATNPNNDTVYLFLNAVIPLLTTFVALVPILRQPPQQSLSTDAVRRDSFIFIVLNVVAIVTGLYLLLFNSFSSSSTTLIAQFLFAGALVLLILPLCLPEFLYTRDRANRNIDSSLSSSRPGLSSNLVDDDDDDDDDDLDLRKELIGNEPTRGLPGITKCAYGGATTTKEVELVGCCCCGESSVMENDRKVALGEEHPVRALVRRWEFWLYYVVYFCGGTIGLVYSNNLGQISESLGFSSQTSAMVTLYSTCSFFGRLLSAAPDYLHDKIYIARTCWLAVALVPTPIAFFLLAASGTETALRVGTGLIGLSSGFIFSAAVSVTSELFGPNSAGINHNILITNIPIGSLLYGLLAALFYDANARSSSNSSSQVLETITNNFLGETMVCMGRKCYFQTFLWWGCISLLGLVSSIMLFVRTKAAYDRFERNRNRTQFSS